MRPYSSATENLAVVGLTPESLSVIVPDTVMETIFPFGGQSLDGCAETLNTGGF